MLEVFVGEIIEVRQLPTSSIISFDNLEIWPSDRDPIHDGRGRQRKSVESAQQRQERYKSVHRTYRPGRNHSRGGSYHLSLPSIVSYPHSSPTTHRQSLTYWKDEYPITFCNVERARAQIY